MCNTVIYYIVCTVYVAINTAIYKVTCTSFNQLTDYRQLLVSN